MPEDKEYEFQYSNFGIALLGLALEDIYQDDYKSLMDSYIGQDLGLYNTFTSLKEDNQLVWDFPHKDQSNLNGESPGQNIFPVDSYWEWSRDNSILSAGAIVSNVEDILRYGELQISDSGYLTRTQEKLADINFEGNNKTLGIYCDGVAMAWILDQEDNIIWHSGGTGDYNTYIGFDPDRKRLVVVLYNYNGLRAIPASSLGRRLMVD